MQRFAIGGALVLVIAGAAAAGYAYWQSREDAGSTGGENQVVTGELGFQVAGIALLERYLVGVFR